MAAAQLLTLAHGIDDKVTRIDDEVNGVVGQVNDIGDTVRVVHNGAQSVIFSYSFLLKHLYGQMEKKQKQSCNRRQKRRLQLRNLWQTASVR